MENIKSVKQGQLDGGIPRVQNRTIWMGSTKSAKQSHLDGEYWKWNAKQDHLDGEYRVWNKANWMGNREEIAYGVIGFWSPWQASLGGKGPDWLTRYQTKS